MLMPFANIGVARLALCGALTAVIGACDNPASPEDGNQPVIPPIPSIPLADHIQVVVQGSDAVQPGGTRVKIRALDTYGKGIVDLTATIPHPMGGTAEIVFSDSVTGGEYTVDIYREDCLPGWTLTAIHDDQIPVVKFNLVPVSESPDVGISQLTLGTEPVEVFAPTSVRYAFGSTTVALSGFQTEATVATMAPVAVPPVYIDREFTGVVISAAMVDLDQVQSGSVLSVGLPIPVEPDQFPDAEGGILDAWVFNFETLLWESLETAVIDSTGHAVVHIANPAARALVAISQMPTVRNLPRSWVTIRHYLPVDIDSMREGGQASIETPLDVEITYSGPVTGEVLNGSSIPGVPPAEWGLAKPSVLRSEYVIRPWLNAGDPIHRVSNILPAHIEIVRETNELQFTFDFGGVTRAFSLFIAYTRARQFAI
jgi:hypothetical protein